MLQARFQRKHHQLHDSIASPAEVADPPLLGACSALRSARSLQERQVGAGSSQSSVLSVSELGTNKEPSIAEFFAVVHFFAKLNGMCAAEAEISGEMVWDHFALATSMMSGPSDEEMTAERTPAHPLISYIVEQDSGVHRMTSSRP